MRQSFSIYKFPELPAFAPPPAAREAGRLGRPGLRVPAWQLPPPLACRGGVSDEPGVPRCRRCPPGTDCTAGLRKGGPKRLRPGSGGRRGSQSRFPLLCVLAPGKRRRRRGRRRRRSCGEQEIITTSKHLRNFQLC